MRTALMLGAVLMSIAAPVFADGRESRHLLVVSGIGGEAFYNDLFHRWAVTFVDLARDHLDLDPAQVVYLAEDPARDPGHIDGPSRRSEIGAALRAISANAGPEDLVMVLLIGHGTARGGRALFNIPGPDISAVELSALLDGLQGRRVVLVNAASASGPFVQAVSRPGRVVITATSSASENQHPRFGGHFVNAFVAPAADRDKDGRVSLLEAFVYATREVERGYEKEKRLRTEHALLDDDGDGVGARTPGREDPDGRLAARVFLTPADSRIPDTEQARSLTVAARTLVDRIEQLRRRKRELGESEYEAQLESLLVELALNRRAMRGSLAP